MLILASRSPRRRQLLDLLKIPYQVQGCDIDESPHEGEAPQDYVRRLATSKAMAVAASVPPRAVILAADTTVAAEHNGKPLILGKPETAAHAREMLTLLRGKQHDVFTAIALYHPADKRLWEEICLTKVKMRHYSEEEISAYIASGDPLDKAGAYAIQNADFHPVENIEGCYANVMGLPLCHTVRLLKQAGILTPADPIMTCENENHLTCPLEIRPPQTANGT